MLTFLANFLPLLFGPQNETILCSCVEKKWMGLIAGLDHKTHEEQQNIFAKLSEKGLDRDKMPPKHIALWFARIDSKQLKLLPFPFRQNSHNYEGADEYVIGQSRILHACAKCINELNEKIRELGLDTEMAYFSKGLNAKIKWRGKDGCMKFYILSTIV